MNWNQIVNWIKNQWKVYPLQIIGAGLLIPAFIIAVIAARTNSDLYAYLSWGLLAIILLIDVNLKWQAKWSGTKATMVTRWIRELLPKRVDNVIMIAFIPLVWWLTGPLFALFYMHGFLNDHFNENR